MSENNNDNDITLSSLIKRRQQVAALAAYHRKTWRKADGSPSVKDYIPSENPLSKKPTEENILQVKATSQPENVKQYDPNKKIKVLSNILVKKTSISTKTFQQERNEDTCIASTSSAAPELHKVINLDKAPVSIDLKKNILLQTPKNTSNTISQKSFQHSNISSVQRIVNFEDKMVIGIDISEASSKATFHESPQQQPSNMFSKVIESKRTLVFTHFETQEPSLDATTLQRPATPAEASSTDLSPIVSYELENLEDDSDATSCSSPQLLSNLPSAAVKISGTHDTGTETPDQNFDAAPPILSFQRPAASTLSEASYNDLKPIVSSQLGYLVDKSEATSCGSPQLSSNLPPAAVEVFSTDDTHAEAPDQSLGATSPISSLQKPAVLSSTAASYNEADHLFADILEKSSDTKSFTRATYFNAEVNKSESFDDKADATITDILLLQELDPDKSDICSETSNVNTHKHAKKRKRLTTSKKAFIDFLSDEDKHDFSGGSSDLWTCNESDVSSDEMEHIKKK